MPEPAAVFKAIIFDMDGVIIDSNKEVEDFWQEKFSLHGLDISQSYMDLHVHGRPGRQTVDNLFPFLSEEEKEAMNRELEQFDSQAESFDLIPGIENMLNGCKKYHIPVALVTSALPAKVSVMLNSLSVDPGFQTIVTADQITNGKPAPECYELAIRRLGLFPPEVIVFEDSVSGVQAAASAGGFTIGVNKKTMQPHLREAGAQFSIENFSRSTFHKKGGTIVLQPDSLANNSQTKNILIVNESQEI